MPPLTAPRVTVITPTWNRHDLLWGRCAPSVRAQTYQDFEHLVVSDGPDPELRYQVDLLNRRSDLVGWPQGRLIELPDGPHRDLGAAARNAGVVVSRSEILAFLDDDNAYRPRALELLVAALDQHPEAGFAYGGLWYPEDNRALEVLDPPAMDHIDGSTFACRRQLFDVACWRGGVYALDWQLIAEWMSAGVRWTRVDEIVLDYWWARR